MRLITTVLRSSYHMSFVMVFCVFVEVDKKGHCFAKTLKQFPPHLGFSSGLCAALRLHANASVFCSDFLDSVLQMVRLFLFRLGSLLGLFGLLVWEAFYRPNGDNFAGKQSRKKIFSSYYVFSTCTLVPLNNLSSLTDARFCRK